MQRTKRTGGAAVPSFPFFKFLIPALFMVSLLILGETGQSVNYGHNYTFVVCGVAALALLIGAPILSLFGIYVACWFAYLLGCGFLGLIPAEILVQALDGSMFIIAGMSLYILTTKSTGRTETVMNGICALSLILSATAFIQYFIGHGDPGATLVCRNVYAAFMAISLPLFFRKGWYKFIPVIVLGLIIAKTSTAIAAALIASAFFVWGWKGAGIAIIPAIAYYLAFKLPVHHLSLGARLDYWTDALGKVSGSWQTLLFGVGPGVYWQFQNELHSEPVYLLFNLGIVGLIIVAAYIFRSFTRSTDRRLQSALLAVVVDSFGNHVMHTAPTALLVIIILGLIDRKNTLEAST
jgi:hypothetical protein